jgi:hypothetical protein
MASTQLSNRISFNPPPEALDRIHSAIAVLQADLVPDLVDLAPDDARVLPKMSAKTVDFVTRALDHMRANPALKPGYVDLDEFARDLDAVAQLRSLLAPLRQVVDLLEDSLTLSASEAYSAALVCYQNVKSAARMNTPGAKVIAEDLGRQFMGRGSRSDLMGTPVPAPAPGPTQQFVG